MLEMLQQQVYMKMDPDSDSQESPGGDRTKQKVLLLKPLWKSSFSRGWGTGRLRHICLSQIPAHRGKAPHSVQRSFDISLLAPKHRESQLRCTRSPAPLLRSIPALQLVLSKSACLASSLRGGQTQNKNDGADEPWTRAHH